MAQARAATYSLKEDYGFAERYGPYLGLYRASKLKPMLVAMYGDKGKVSQYKVGEVLTVLWMDHNEQAHNDWVQYSYGKIAEERARVGK